MAHLNAMGQNEPHQTGARQRRHSRKDKPKMRTTVKDVRVVFAALIEELPALPEPGTIHLQEGAPSAGRGYAMFFTPAGESYWMRPPFRLPEYLGWTAQEAYDKIQGIRAGLAVQR